MKRVFFGLTFAMLCASVCVKAQSRVWMVGDGSMATYVADSTEARGWGQMLEQSLQPKVAVVNDAKLGMSAKVFMDEDGMKQLGELRAKTIMLLQLGANDLKEYNPQQYSAPEAFIRRLQEIVSLALKNKIHIVLCTPLSLPYYKDGELIDRFGGYADIVRHVAMYNHLTLLDLEQASREWLGGMTQEEASQYFLSVDASEVLDAEYLLNEKGATVVAGLVRDAILNTKDKKLQKLLK
jgi:lysophospholipase L1-like esterase